MSQVVNPLTGRRILVGSALYKKLVRQGHIQGGVVQPRVVVSPKLYEENLIDTFLRLYNKSEIQELVRMRQQQLQEVRIDKKEQPVQQKTISYKGYEFTPEEYKVVGELDGFELVPYMGPRYRCPGTSYSYKYDNGEVKTIHCKHFTDLVQAFSDEQHGIDSE